MSISQGQRPSSTSGIPNPNGNVSKNQCSSDSSDDVPIKDEADQDAPASIHTDIQYSSRKDVRDRLKILLGLAKPTSPAVNFSSTLDQRTRSLDDYPIGYPKLAAMEDLDPNFMITRRFGWLHMRLLLHLQDEITELEATLQAMDKLNADTDPLRLVSRRRDEGFDNKRKDLLQTIDEKLIQYDELTLRINKLGKLQKPTPRNQTSLHNMLHNTGSQTAGESKWIHYRDDLVALAHDNERSGLNVFVEDALCAVSRTVALALFRTDSQRRRTGAEADHINLLSHERLDAVASTLVTVIATALLLAPTAILHSMPAKGLPQIGVTFGFVLLFALCCAVFTRPRKQEIFMATAAYAAVLVVFLGNRNDG